MGRSAISLFIYGWNWLRGRWSFFEAGFEKDPHGPGTAGIDVDLKNSPTSQLVK